MKKAESGLNPEDLFQTKNGDRETSEWTWEVGQEV